MTEELYGCWEKGILYSRYISYGHKSEYSRIKNYCRILSKKCIAKSTLIFKTGGERTNYFSKNFRRRVVPKEVIITLTKKQFIDF